MPAFCPLIREKCKVDECMAWKDDRCLVFSYLEVSISPLAHELTEIDTVESIFALDQSPRQVRVPTEIKSATPEQLAAELVSFAKREFSHEDRISIGYVAQFFWEEKGVEKWAMPSEIKLKLEKAERLAQHQIDNEREAEVQARLEREKAELSHLVSRCVEWARKQGFKRVTQADVDAFLFEEQKELLPQTKRAIWATANVQLKSTVKK